MRGKNRGGWFDEGDSPNTEYLKSWMNDETIQKKSDLNPAVLSQMRKFGLKKKHKRRISTMGCRGSLSSSPFLEQQGPGCDGGGGEADAGEFAGERRE